MHNKYEKCIMKIILIKKKWWKLQVLLELCKNFKAISQSDINNQFTSFNAKSCTLVVSMTLIL